QNVIYVSPALARIATVWADGLAGALSARRSTISCPGGGPNHGRRHSLHPSSVTATIPRRCYHRYRPERCDPLGIMADDFFGVGEHSHRRRVVATKHAFS